MTRALHVVAGLLLIGAVVSGCWGGEQVAPGAPFMGGIRYYHDDQHKVGCWTTSDKSVSCLPDNQYEAAP